MRVWFCALAVCALAFSSCSREERVTFVFDAPFLFALPESARAELEKEARILILEEAQQRFGYFQMHAALQSDALVILPSLIPGVETLMRFFRPAELPSCWALPFGEEEPESELLALRGLQLDRTDAYREAGIALAQWLAETPQGGVGVFLTDGPREREEADALVAALEEYSQGTHAVRRFLYPRSESLQDELLDDMNTIKVEAHVFIIGSAFSEVANKVAARSEKLVVEALFPEFMEIFAADAAVAFEITDFVDAVQEKAMQRGYVPARFFRYSIE